MDYINLKHSRTEKQKEVMEKIQQEEVCPFCPQNLSKYHDKPIIKEGDWWLISENFQPYEGTKHHFILFYKKHATKLSDLDPNAGKELLELISWLEKEYGIKGGSLFLRFGNTEMTGSSVAHLHPQIIVGNSDRSDPHDGLKVKLGYKKPKK